MHTQFNWARAHAIGAAPIKRQAKVVFFQFARISCLAISTYLLAGQLATEDAFSASLLSLDRSHRSHEQPIYFTRHRAKHKDARFTCDASQQIKTSSTSTEPRSEQFLTHEMREEVRSRRKDLVGVRSHTSKLIGIRWLRWTLYMFSSAIARYLICNQRRII